MKVFPADMQIVHLDQDNKAPPFFGNITVTHWQLINHPVYPQDGLPKVASLGTVNWLDVSAVFKNQQAGKYKVQWRMNNNGAYPQPLFEGTEFLATGFMNEQDLSAAQERTPTVLLKPSSVQEFMQHTDRPGTVPGRATNFMEMNKLNELPGYDPDSQGFFTLTLPGEIQIEQGGGIITRIRNHENTRKVGLQIEYAQLIPAI
ncbi:hypothetical protein BGZ76_003990 [Entomortierella beljakovae]|nr:hypothetical protein BGZ76_003990 [Entomortierella beljakovae]